MGDCEIMIESLQQLLTAKNFLSVGFWSSNTNAIYLTLKFHVTAWCLTLDITYKATVPELVTAGFTQIGKR